MAASTQVDARRKAFQGRFQSLNARQPELRHAVETPPERTRRATAYAVAVAASTQVDARRKAFQGRFQSLNARQPERLMEIENLFRYTALAVGLKPSANQGKARLRGLYRIIYSKTINRACVDARRKAFQGRFQSLNAR